MENMEKYTLSFEDLLKNLLESKDENDFIEKMKKTIQNQENGINHYVRNEKECNCHNKKYENQNTLQKIKIPSQKVNCIEKHKHVNNESHNNQKYTFKTNIYQHNNGVEIISELPGININNIDIEITEDLLTIIVKTGYNAQFNENMAENIICVKRESNDFLYCGENRLVKKSISIKNVERMEATATYENGLLSICLRNPKPQPKSKIKVQIN